MEEKEAFVEPVVEIVVLEDDVICTSGCTGPDQLKELDISGQN